MVGSGQVRWGPVRLGKVRSGGVRHGWVRSGTVWWVSPSGMPFILHDHTSAVNTFFMHFAILLTRGTDTALPTCL